MESKNRLAIILIIFLLLISFNFLAYPQDVFLEEDILYYFWEEGCPTCDEAWSLLVNLKQQYPELEIKTFEIGYNEPNRIMFEQIVVQYDINPVEVPVFIFNHNYWVGFTRSMEERVRDYFALEGKRTEENAKEGIYIGYNDPKLSTTEVTIFVSAQPTPSNPQCGLRLIFQGDTLTFIIENKGDLDLVIDKIGAPEYIQYNIGIPLNILPGGEEEVVFTCGSIQR